MTRREGLSGCRETCGEPRKNAAGRIFETARELFYQRGIRAVGVDEIVSQAGVTKPSLYRAFESKDDLVAACLESYREDFEAEMARRMADAGDDPLAQLRAFVAHYVEQLSDPNFRGCPMTNTAVEFPESGHPGRDLAEACKLEARERLVGMTRRLDVAEPEALADGLMLLIEGAFSMHHVFGSQGPGQVLRESTERLIASHLKA